MDDERKKLPARFFRSSAGNEPVRDWLMSLAKADRKAIGVDISTVEYGWPIGMPTTFPRTAPHESCSALPRGR